MATLIDTSTLTLAANPHYSWYAELLKKWPSQWAGPKPTRQLFDLAYSLDPTKRAGVEQLHVAMCLRTGGCTVQQFQTAGSCGPANNYRRALIASGVVKVAVVGKPYAYALTVTPKGAARIARTVAAAAAEVAKQAETKADKPAKAKVSKAKRKPAKVTPAAVEATPAEVTIEPVAVEPVTAPVEAAA